MSTIHHLQSAFEESSSYSRYHPSKGYSWDLKERKVPERASKKESQREEPSSLFQRQRVDMLLAELTRKFPVHVVPQQKVTTIGERDFCCLDTYKGTYLNTCRQV